MFFGISQVKKPIVVYMSPVAKTYANEVESFAMIMRIEREDGILTGVNEI